MKARPPFTALHRNIMLSGDRAAGLYRLDVHSYEFLSEQGKERLHGQLAWWAFSVGADFSLWRVSRAYPADRYVEATAELADERIADPKAWRALLEGHARRLQAMRSFETEVYVAVSLAEKRRPSLRGPKHEAKALADAEQEAFDNLTEHLPARRAFTHEVQWLLCRAACRGIGEPDLDPYWMPPALTLDGGTYEPRGATLVRHRAAILEEERALVVEAETGRSYQAMLALGTLPHTSRFPGGAELLFSPLEALDFPVDVVMHVHWRDNDDMQKLARNRVKDADVTALEDPGRSWAPEQNRVMARDVFEYFSTEPYPPGLEASISFAVGAPSREELKLRVARLRKRYGSVRLFLPYGLQGDLYEDHLPRPDGGRVRDYADILTMEQFGALMPVGTHAGGSQRGIYFAHTIPGAPRPVKHDPTEAPRTNRAPSILLCGALGRGKTIAAELLCVHGATRGSLVVDVDPKARPDHNLEGVPSLDGRVHVIELSGEEHNRGLLDPMVIPPTELREELASAYFMEILPTSPPPWATQIRRAVKAVLLEPDPSSLRVLEWLARAEHEEARQVGEALEVWADSGLGRLAFGDGSRALAAAQRPVTSIKAPSLALPPPGVPRADYDQAERMSVATTKLLVGYAMRLIATDRTIHKILHFDEAHVLLGAGDGRRLLDRLNRMGRSVNATLILSTQLLGDVGEDIEGLIGTRMVFGQQTDAQARTVLPILGLDPSDERLVRLLRGFTAGRCLMRGIDDRVVAVQVDPADDALLAALDTAPVRLGELVA